jgi:hypothetical protein
MNPETLFSHMPLDLSSSKTMRLIEVLPLQDGNSSVHCRLTHTTNEAEYACLSYVWGTDSPDRAIYINGLRFNVRQNLWDFLQYASFKVSQNASAVVKDDRNQNVRSAVTDLLWIDALCIDQDNTLERNHQVQQMGRFYEHAQHVVVWLGNDSDTASFLKEFTKQQTAKIRFNQLAGIKIFCKNAYWQRAWITQEVLLARNISFVAERNEVDLAVLIPALRDYLGGFVRSYGYRHYQIFYDLLERGAQYSLIENIWRFRQKKCLHRRDLIYSLLSVSRLDEALKVDYELPTIDLALNMIRSLGTVLCVCNMKIVLQALECSKDMSVFGERPFVFLTLPAPLVWSAIPQCPRCREPIAFDKIRAHFSAVVRFVCLGCFHYESRLRCPTHQDSFRHGHIVLVPEIEGGKRLWHTYWLRPNQIQKVCRKQELHGPLSGIRVLKMENDVPCKLLVSSRVFAKWAAEEFEAEFKPRQELRTSGVLTKERNQATYDPQNPMWVLSDNKVDRNDVHMACTCHAGHDRLHHIVSGRS